MFCRDKGDYGKLAHATECIELAKKFVRVFP